MSLSSEDQTKTEDPTRGTTNLEKLDPKTSLTSEDQVESMCAAPGIVNLQESLEKSVQEILK